MAQSPKKASKQMEEQKAVMDAAMGGQGATASVDAKVTESEGGTIPVEVKVTRPDKPDPRKRTPEGLARAIGMLDKNPKAKKKAPKKEIRYTVILDPDTARDLEAELQRQRWEEGREKFSRSELIREAVLAYLSKS